jgi:uncharacterized membrane protein
VRAAGTGRLWEVDAARTAAIAMMVAYHTGYDIHRLVPGIGLDPFAGGWRALQVATGSSFLTIVGVSLWISNARARGRGARGVALYRRHARRAAQVLGAALVVSAATRIALGDEYVRFGILHCIGVAMLLAPLFVRLGPWNLALGALAIAAGLAIRDRALGGPDALALVSGFAIDGEGGVDRYPLLPWFGPVLIGLAVGWWLYPAGRRGRLTARIPDAPPRALVLAGAPGRHALPVYLIHQPVLFPLVALLLWAAGHDVTFDAGG